MRATCIGLLAFAFALACGPARADEDHAASIVRVFASQRQPDYVQPWQMKSQVRVSGSGFIIPGHRILTNLHVVADAMEIEVRKDGSDDRVAARVAALASDSDLALLTVDDPDFFEDTKPVRFGGLPAPGTHIQAYGYTQGADEVSETDGVVSRIVETDYAISSRRIAALQIDAALNPGNSGGPVFSGDLLVGMGFQTNRTAQNVGYVIPVPIIQGFLEGIRKGPYAGVPLLGVSTTRTENPAFRAWCGLPSGVTGDYIDVVSAGSSADHVLRTGDVLLRIADRPIRNDGSITLDGGTRVPSSLLIQERQVGDTVPVEVWRAGAVQRLTLTLRAGPALVPYQVERKPSYLIYGGLLFEPLTMDYVFQRAADRMEAGRLIHYSDLIQRGVPRPWRSQVVILAGVLDDPVNKGYHKADLVLERVNGHAIGDMGDLRDALEHPQRGLQVMEFDDVPYVPGKPAERVILRASEAEAANPRILRRYGIPADRSPDLAGGSEDSMRLRTADSDDASQGPDTDAGQDPDGTGGDDGSIAP